MQILEILVRRMCILSEICWFRQYQLIGKKHVYHAHSHKWQEFVSPTFMTTFFSWYTFILFLSIY